MDRSQVVKDLKDVTFPEVLKDWLEIASKTPKEIEKLNGRSRVGCNLIDYYFFEQRIETIGNKGINFFQFVDDIENYKKKKYIQTLLTYCDNHNRYKESIIKKYYYCYGLCFGRINAFKITNALQIYNRYPPSIAVMDPFCGFGGRLTGAMMKNINYIGFDLNKDLEKGYQSLIKDFREKTNSKIELIFQDSNTIDYSKYKYDMVFTSPPYENIEIYKHMERKSIEEWTKFYKEVFQKLWDGLEQNGTYIININEKIYTKILDPLFGPSTEVILLKKSSKNDYKEYIYIWKKLN
jgi:site-specific DNA-adenine methylase